MDVTESQLATALEGFYVRALAPLGGPVTVQLYSADETAAALYATLSRMAALREPHPTGPRLADADLCARCGNQFKPGQACDACRVLTADPWADEPGPPVVHVHCEHAPASRAAYELGHADQIVEMLGRLPERHVKRVLRWAWDYLTDDDEPPF